MTTSELMLQDYDLEMANTRRVLERVPEDKPNYKPHEKSMAMGKLAMHIAALPLLGKAILTTPSLDMADPSYQRPDTTFRTRAIVLSTFDAAAAAARAALAASSDADLAALWKISAGNRIISHGPRSLTFRHMFVSHLIHHRAQLGVYLRLNDIPVPGTFGPSADEPIKP